MRSCTSLRGAHLSVLASAVSAVLFGGGATQAFAQEQQRSSESASVEEVVVTGTRIRRDDFTTPNSVATLTAEDMKDLGIVSVADMMLQMTSNVATASLDTTGDSAFFVGATLANLRGMNTSFGTRTLTLVNGRRMPSTTNGGGVDLSMIPSVLVGRMETVTGGAGATYGSDAMAGVVNIILDRNLEGTRVQAGYYTTHEGDGDQYNFSLANGSYVLDGRGHVTVGFEHQTIDPILNCHEARDWCRRSFNFLDSNDNPNNNPNPEGPFGRAPYPSPDDPREYEGSFPVIPNPAFPGQPRYWVVDDVRYLHSSHYGSLHTNNERADDPWNGTFAEFTPDGRDIVPYQEGLTGVMRDYAYGGANRRIQGGDGKLYSHGHNLRNGSVRNNFYTRFNYDFNDRLSANIEVTFNRNEGQNKQMRPGFNRESLCINTTNAFLQGMSQEALDVIAARQSTSRDVFGLVGCSLNSSIFSNTPGTTLYKDWSDQIDRGTQTETEMMRVMIGASGGLFGSDNWTWDTYLQYGETDRYQLLYNNKTNFRYTMAMDSVIDSVTGQPVCRVNESGFIGAAARSTWVNYFQGTFTEGEQTARAEERFDALRAGCAPLNPFGLAASPEALAYAYDDLIEYTYTDNTVLSGTFSGAFWKGFGAGPARLAAGIDYREDNTDNRSGGNLSEWVRTDFSSQYGDPWTGGTEVADIFAEVEIPLLQGKPGAEYLSINLSNRRSKNTTFRNDAEESLSVDRYSDSYKVSMVWNPTNWMTLRATRSADIRQPAARELFYRQTQQSGGFFNFTPNPWIEGDQRNSDTWDNIIGANPNLQNETAINETLGLVFTPDGWGRGLQFAVDYFRINVKGGISYATGSDPENEENLPYPIFRCYQYEDPYYCDQIEFGPPLIADNPRSNILSVTTTQENSEPFWSSGVDFSVRYHRQLSQGGSFSIRMLATHNIEQNICTNVTRTSPTETVCESRQDVVGQTGGLYGGSIFSNYTPTPTWSGNLFGTYRKNAWSVTAQARYTGSGLGSVFWVGPEDPRWAPDTHFTISRNRMPSWTTWNTTFNYDFNRSRFASSRFDEMSLSLTIDNLFDRQPGFWSGGNIAGVNTRMFSGMGRSYRLNYSMAF